VRFIGVTEEEYEEIKKARCPDCGELLGESGFRLDCPEGHAFEVIQNMVVRRVTKKPA